MPDPRMPKHLKKMLSIDKTFSVESTRAETVLKDLGVVPEIVKIDVQGAEGEALKGFGSLFSSIFCCELEVSFMRSYREQPLFNDIFDFMIDSGFGLFDVKVFGVAGTRNSTQANAYFCRKDIDSSRQKLVERLFCSANDFTYRP
jgi:hypothetical protein